MTQKVSARRPTSLRHSARTATAAIVSLAVAQLCGLPEAYWAAISTLIVMQSTLGATLSVSGQRLAGSALGAVAAAPLAAYFGSNVLAFGVGVFLLGLICTGLRLDRAAYRFAGVTLAIVMLVARPSPAWVVAAHRFIEVTVGIAVGLVFTALWSDQPSS